MTCQTQTTSAIGSDRQITLCTSMPRSVSRNSRAEGEVGKKASSKGHRGASREPRRGVIFAAAELEELVKTSELVPQTRPRKNSMDSDAASTMAATSAEPSPMLGFVVADDDDVWPSVREAASGWDFCSDVSEGDSDMWQDLPEPAMNLDIPFSEFLMNAEAPLQFVSSDPKLSFADVILSESNEPFGDASRVPAISAQCRSRVTSTKHDGKAADDVKEQANEELFVPQNHGWTKKHKSSRSTKYQRKVAEKMVRRANQASTNSQSSKSDDLELED